MFLPISRFVGLKALHSSCRVAFFIKSRCCQWLKMQAAGVTLLPIESALNTRVLGADFEGAGYVYLFFSFRG